jgi:hypothetical protein
LKTVPTEREDEIMAKKRYPTVAETWDGIWVIKDKSVDLDWNKAREAKPAYYSMRQQTEKIIKGLSELFGAGLIDKWNFYSICEVALKRRWIGIRRMAEVSGIDEIVVWDRINDLRKM